MMTQHPLVYVIGRDTWSLKEDGAALSSAMLRGFGLSVPVITAPDAPQNRILHYINRYEYLDNADAGLDPSNRVILTWYHGAPDHPDFSPMYARLLPRLPEIRQIVTSCTSTERHLRAAGVPADLIRVIPLGVDLTQFTPPDVAQRARVRADFGIPDDALCIGSFQQDGVGGEEGNEPKLIKGPDVFLEVVARLFRRQPRLFILLTGFKRGYIKRGLTHIGVPFVHVALTAQREIVRCFHAADLILITAREEGGPKALLEAWASGVPLISTRMGMPADHIRDGENGLLADNEDVDGLTAAAERVSDGAELRTNLIAGGLVAVQDFTWDAAAAQHYHQIYKRLGITASWV